jgi:hypothetical protein
MSAKLGYMWVAARVRTNYVYLLLELLNNVKIWHADNIFLYTI